MLNFSYTKFSSNRNQCFSNRREISVDFISLCVIF